MRHALLPVQQEIRWAQNIESMTVPIVCTETEKELFQEGEALTRSQKKMVHPKTIQGIQYGPFGPFAWLRWLGTNFWPSCQGGHHFFTISSNLFRPFGEGLPPTLPNNILATACTVSWHVLSPGKPFYLTPVRASSNPFNFSPSW